MPRAVPIEEVPRPGAAAAPNSSAGDAEAGVGGAAGSSAAGDAEAGVGDVARPAAGDAEAGVGDVARPAAAAAPGRAAGDAVRPALAASAPASPATTSAEPPPSPNGKANPAPPRTARGEATRQRLLDSAEALFGQGGFHDTSIVDITGGAGVGHGTFYLYFGSKEEIFRELVRRLSHQLRATLHEATAGAADRVEVETAGARAFLSFAAAHHDLYRIVSDSQFIDPELFRWYYEHLAEGYARGLARAMDAGEVERMDPETLAYCLMGASHFLGMRWIVWEGREPPETAMSTLVNVVRRTLRP